jgi:formate/nitrite transporter FocA (FNT family)
MKLIEPPGSPVTNPIHDSFNISVLVPEEITIRMVDASTLSDYEVWFFLSSVLASAFVGFLVPYLMVRADDPSAASLFWMTTVMAVLFAISFCMALGKRSLLRRRGRTMKLKTSLAAPVA